MALERRLTAILTTDVVEYSRLTGLDEEGTHAQLQDHLRCLVDPKIGEHRGRIVKWSTARAACRRSADGVGSVRLRRQSTVGPNGCQ